MTNRRFFWRAHPFQALAEAWLLALLILVLLWLQVGIVSPYVVSNGLLFLCGACGMRCVLRVRLPAGGWFRQLLVECLLAVAVSLIMVAGVTIPVLLLGWEALWQAGGLGGAGPASLLLGATGPGYLVARLGVRAWLLWERLRRRRMLWAITHAHLALVVLLACLAALGIFLASPFSRGEAPLQPGPAGLLASLTERLLHTVFPGMGIVFFMTVLALLALLPPSALFSYLVARRTTRRLEVLVRAAQALRAGKYGTRVGVAGEDEVAQLQADFNAMAGELERTLHDLEVQRDTVTRLFRARRELVAGVSHELRTPVATMRALLEPAMDRRSEIEPEWLCHDLEVIGGELQRLQGLLDDLFTLSQAEAGGLAIDCRPADIVPVVQRMVAAAAPLAWESSRVEVVADLPPRLPPANVDAARLEQVLANLLHNGIRHTAPGGIVAASAREQEGAILVQVRDTGEGIAADDLPRIWERFYRGRGAGQAGGGGAGLGLALVKELTEAMGGSVAVESEVGQGSCFTVRLPRA